MRTPTLEGLTRAAEHWQRLCAEHPEAADPAWLSGMRRFCGRGSTAQAVIDFYGSEPDAILDDYERYAEHLRHLVKR